MLRVNDDHAFDRGKPEPAVPRLPAGGRRSAVALTAFHPVFQAIGHRSHGLEPAFGHEIEFLFADAVDALVTAYPQIPAIVFEDLMRDVVVQPFTHGEGGDAP